MEAIEESSVIFCNKKAVHKVPFSKMKRNFEEQLRAVLGQIVDENVCVGLLMKKNLFLPLLIERLQDLGLCFIFLNSQDIDKVIRFLKLEWIISYDTDSIENFQLLSCIKLSHNINYKMWKSKESKYVKVDLDFNGIFCVMMTSGSTGDKKFVRIPYSCIENNVKSLQEKFEVCSEDIILWSTPLTFDPTLVELLLFQYAQSTILFTSDITFLNPGYFLDLLVDNRVTFIQMVPSVFFRWNSIQIEYLLNQSSLKVLAFGGEPFPRQILNYKRKSDLRLFNLYGVTELSCWASVHRITCESAEDEIPIGEATGDTYLEVRDMMDDVISEGIGEICVGSTHRVCLVNHQTRNDFDTPIVRTGDLAEINNKGIFYKGRKNRIVKRLGQKVNLSKIEETIFRETQLQSRGVFDDGKILLFILIPEHFDATSKVKLLDKLRVKMLQILSPQDFPDLLGVVSKFPLNNHGKICDKILKKFYSDDSAKKNSAVEEFDRLCSRYFGTMENIHKFTFVELGTSSILTIQFLAELSQNLGTELPASFVSVLFEKPLEYCRMHLENVKFSVKRKLDEENDSRGENSTNSRLDTLDVVWKYDLLACVDCSPVVFEFKEKILIAVGSFAHIFVILDEEGTEYLKLFLSDNIEATACVSARNGCIFVGCYDGNFYCIDLVTKEIRWKYSTGGKIKSCPIEFKNDEAIVLGSYDNCVYCLCQKTGTKIWTVSVIGSVSSNIISNENIIFVGTLKGLCYCLNDDGHILWSYDVKVPLFGTHCIVKDDVIWPDVTGTLHCTAVLDGSLLWKCKIDGHIFSSLAVSENRIYVGCQDANLYELVLSDSVKIKPTILGKFKLDSDISTTSCVYEKSKEKFLVCLSNSGRLYVANIMSGRIILEGKLPNQCFSSPFVFKGCVYVGCRDNFLYKIKLVDF